ncbi:MAG TPA: hypothetical protein VGB56_10615 [Flavisolibacter sp.]|jgi:hypothetical protein
MQDLEIDVSEIEALQTISNTRELNRIFARAQSTVVNGATVILYRKSSTGDKTPFDKIATEADLSAYKKSVFKYLPE